MRIPCKPVEECHVRGFDLASLKGTSEALKLDQLSWTVSRFDLALYESS